MGNNLPGAGGVFCDGSNVPAESDLLCQHRPTKIAPAVYKRGFDFEGSDRSADTLPAIPEEYAPFKRTPEEVAAYQQKIMESDLPPIPPFQRRTIPSKVGRMKRKSSPSTNSHKKRKSITKSRRNSTQSRRNSTQSILSIESVASESGSDISTLSTAPSYKKRRSVSRRSKKRIRRKSDVIEDVKSETSSARKRKDSASSGRSRRRPIPMGFLRKASIKGIRKRSEPTTSLSSSKNPYIPRKDSSHKDIDSQPLSADIEVSSVFSPGHHKNQQSRQKKTKEKKQKTHRKLSSGDFYDFQHQELHE